VEADNSKGALLRMLTFTGDNKPIKKKNYLSQRDIKAAHHFIKSRYPLSHLPYDRALPELRTVTGPIKWVKNCCKRNPNNGTSEILDEDELRE
jgi:hypothetical protein